jgi:hypothetical protein
MPFRPKRSNTQSEADLAAIEKLNLNGSSSSPLSSPGRKKQENQKSGIEASQEGSNIVETLESKVNGTG